MNSSNQPLDYATVRASYKAEFGVTPPGDLIKSITIPAVSGLQQLCRAMQQAVEDKTPIDFNAYAKAFFKSLVDCQPENDSTSEALTPA